MRISFLICLVLAFSAQGQINHSATELAKENVQEYLVKKIFRNKVFRPLEYGSLEPYAHYDPDISWVFEQRCEVTQTVRYPGKDSTYTLPYKFVFYLDSKLKVFRAESFQGNLLVKDDDRPVSTAGKENRLSNKEN